MKDNRHKNIIAVSIGFACIFAIAILTFYRPRLSQNFSKTDSKTIDNSEDTKTQSYSLDNGKLSERLKAKTITIIDTRDADAFQKEHILDSKNISDSNMNAALTGLEKNKAYAIVDDGSGSGQNLAINILPQNGIRNVFYLEGGFPNWKNSNMPTISAGDPNSFSDQSKVNYLKSEQLKDLLAKEDNSILIDLRSQENFNKGHLKGAMNIFLDDLEDKRTNIPTGKKIILYDKNGLWAFQGAVRLFDMGFFNVFCLSDGLDGWQQKNYPLAK